MTYKQWVRSLNNHAEFLSAGDKSRIVCNYCGGNASKYRTKDNKVHLNGCQKPSCRRKVFLKNMLFACLNLFVLEKQEAAGLTWTYLIHIKGHPWAYAWGKVPWRQLKRMPWSFKPIFQVSRYETRSNSM